MIKKKKLKNYIRAPTVDVPYVPNAKYLAHLAHQTPFDPIYQMCHISYFLQHTIVESQICHSTDRCGIWIYYFFIPVSLSSLRQSHPQTPILFSLSPQSSPLKPQPSLLFHADADANADNRVWDRT